LIDPLGFALENFDVIGGWRVVDESGNPLDTLGTMPSGVGVQGFAGLRGYMLAREEQFVHAFTEKLMAYALGRRVEYQDQPVVRKIVRASKAQDYRWSVIIAGIVQSPPFLMRTAPSELAGN
jgi:hypothetical protein